jgi:hypothetical protein
MISFGIAVLLIRLALISEGHHPASEAVLYGMAGQAGNEEREKMLSGGWNGSTK